MNDRTGQVWGYHETTSIFVVTGPAERGLGAIYHPIVWLDDGSVHTFEERDGQSWEEDGAKLSVSSAPLIVRIL